MAGFSLGCQGLSYALPYKFLLLSLQCSRVIPLMAACYTKYYCNAAENTKIMDKGCSSLFDIAPELTGT